MISISDSELFVGLCFLFSSYSKDDVQESCIIARGRRILSSGFSSVDLLGDLEGSSEKFAFSSVLDSSFLSNCEIYLDHTPKPIVLDYLSDINFRRLTYYPTEDISCNASMLSSKISRFQGNLNWIRDRIEVMKGFDIFS